MRVSNDTIASHLMPGVEPAWGMPRLDPGPVPAPFCRAYFGSEFCQRLIPSNREMEKIMGLAGRIPLTLLTPMVTPEGLEHLVQLLDYWSTRSIEGSEVVANDWGVLRILVREYPAFTPVVGRLLNKQPRDPRSGCLTRENPDPVDKSGRCATALEGEPVSAFLSRLGVDRCECDNALGGRRHRFPWKATLHLPYVYLTSGRLCPWAAWEAGTLYRSLPACGLQCGHYGATLHPHGFPHQILATGCAQHIHHPVLSGNLPALGVDRICWWSAPPL